VSDGARAGATELQAQAEVAQLIVQTSALVRGARDVDKVLLAFLRATHRFLNAEASCIAVRHPGRADAELRLSLPREEAWDRDLLQSLTSSGEARVPLGVLSARLERRGRDWGVVVMRRRDGTFGTAQRHALQRIAAEMSEWMRRLDRERLAEVRARIDLKILRDLAPKDLYYQVLDGLHQLTHYTHSASLAIHAPGDGRLRVEAEQIAWRKMKSPRIGLERRFPAELMAWLDGDTVYGFDFLDGDWREWTTQGSAALARALDPADPTAADPAPPMGAMLCTSLGDPQSGLAVLQLGSLHPGAFGHHELEIVRQFAPAMAIALERARAGEKVRRQVLAAERHAVFAHLARGVAHDVNNALGAVLPLVQQMRVDLAAGKVEPEVLAEDLREIDHSLDVCRRIFAGMLRWARGTSAHSGACDAPRAVRNAIEVLDGMLRRAGVKVELRLADGLPPVRGSLAEMEQLFLNLATNAIEAMPRGGTLRLEVAREDTRVRAVVEDTGRGIPPEQLGEIEEPFVTTKENGTGLGLPTCRSILAGVGGDMTIESEPGRGTRVTVRLRVDEGGEG
jgi:signal transduction histidine kinase